MDLRRPPVDGSLHLATGFARLDMSLHGANGRSKDDLPDEVARIPLFVVARIHLSRQCLSEALVARGPFNLVGTASDDPRTLDEIRLLKPRVVVIDFSTADALLLARDIARSVPLSRVVAFGVDDCEHDTFECANANVAGYVTKDATLDDLVGVALVVARGAWPSPRWTGATPYGRVSSWMARADRAPRAVTSLTAREREVLRLLEDGLSNKEIARRLNIEVATVKNHVHNLIGKLHVSSRGEAAAVMRMPRV